MNIFNLISDRSFFQGQSAIFFSSYSGFVFSHHHSSDHGHLAH